MADENRSQLLHQGVGFTRCVVDVGEYGLALDDEQEVLLAEARWEESAVFAHEQCFLRCL